MARKAGFVLHILRQKQREIEEIRLGSELSRGVHRSGVQRVRGF